MGAHSSNVFLTFYDYPINRILRTMVENSKIRNLQALEVRFIAGVLRDAEKLYWPQGQLEKRKLSINMVMTGRIAEAWEEESNLYGLTESDDEKDNTLFKEHGWNKVDSGFQLWGAGKTGETPTDIFLQSKGWNSVDSGFRII